MYACHVTWKLQRYISNNNFLRPFSIPVALRWSRDDDTTRLTRNVHLYIYIYIVQFYWDRRSSDESELSSAVFAVVTVDNAMLVSLPFSLVSCDLIFVALLSVSHKVVHTSRVSSTDRRCALVSSAIVDPWRLSTETSNAHSHVASDDDVVEGRHLYRVDCIYIDRYWSIDMAERNHSTPTLCVSSFTQQAAGSLVLKCPSAPSNWNKTNRTRVARFRGKLTILFDSIRPSWFWCHSELLPDNNGHSRLVVNFNFI